jgi:Skp family chaperone for outer membrane proteins
MPAPGGAGQGKLAALFEPRSKALAARQADLEARRRRLIAEGKLDAEEAPAPAPEPEATPPALSAATNVKDRMAARRERVRKAREEGKLD